MCKPLVYLDQNIVSSLANKEIRLSHFDEFTFVYSKENFAEINRSSEPQKYLDALHEIDAKLLQLQLCPDYRLTGRAELREDCTPSHYYSEYINEISKVPQGDNIFDPFIAWCNGGKDDTALRALPSALKEAIQDLSDGLPDVNREFTECHDSTILEFNDLISELFEHDNDIKKTRATLGYKPNISGITGDNIIEQIWNVVSKNNSGVTCDEFFGFNPINKQGYDNFPMYLGIVSCCSHMDMLGFQAESKCRKVDKISNILSYASHIAMGAYCSLILSFDKRLVKRANAIYQYKGIDAQAMLANKNPKSDS